MALQTRINVREHAGFLRQRLVRAVRGCVQAGNALQALEKRRGTRFFAQALPWHVT
jgi:hypothetical protein